jgi:hypothetical protein
MQANYITNQEWAMNYTQRLEWPIIPLAPHSKTPLRGSHGLHDASCDPSQVGYWWKETPDADVGIVPSRCPRPIVVLDFDFDSGGEELAQAVSEVLPGVLEATASVRTLNGIHRYYRVDGSTPTLPKLEAMAAGLQVFGPKELGAWPGYTVAPQSGHPDDHDFRYSWMDAPPWELAPAPYPIGLHYFLVGLLKGGHGRGVGSRTGRGKKAEAGGADSDGADDSWSSPSNSTAPEGSLLRELDHDLTFIRSALDLMGVPGAMKLDPGKGFASPLRLDRKPSCSLYADEAGAYRYTDFTRSYRGGRAFFSIAEVYAAWIAGQATPVPHLSPTRYAQWQTRLALETGYVEPGVFVPATPLPPKASREAEIAWNNFRLLLQVRSVHFEGIRPAPYSYQFASWWSGLSEKQAENAVVWLRRNGFLIAAGKEKPARGRELTLFLPKGAEGAAEGGLR